MFILFYANFFTIAIFKIKADIRMNKTTLNSQKEKHSMLSLRRATSLGLLSLKPHTHFYPRSPCGERRQKCTKQWGTFAHMKQILWGLHLHADRQGCILPFLPLFFPYFLVRRNREFYDLPSPRTKQTRFHPGQNPGADPHARLCFCNGFPVDKSAGCPIPNRSVRSILL